MWPKLKKGQREHGSCQGQSGLAETDIQGQGDRGSGRKGHFETAEGLEQKFRLIPHPTHSEILITISEAKV